MRRAVVCCLLLGLFPMITPRVSAGGAVTWSFGAGEAATCPRTITCKDARIIVDLAALPKDARPFRAILRCQRENIPGRGHEREAALVIPEGDDKPLPLLPPRFHSFDATKAVVQAVKDGGSRVEFTVKSLRGWKRETTRLDIWFTGGKAVHPSTPTTNLTARHRSGQTLLTWKEAGPPTTAQEMTIQQWRELNKKLAAESRKTTYRIYRHTEPLTGRTIDRVELVDEVGPLTCWNAEFHGIYPDAGDKVFRYVVDGPHRDASPASPVPPGTGIYAHNPARGGKAYYHISTAINGEEDFAALAKGADGPH